MTKNLSYNTDNAPIVLMEYGRNVQKLIEHICTIQDKELRTNYAHTIIKLLKQLNPSLKESTENTQRLWDHMYLLSDYKLDVNGPYAPPLVSNFHKKPMRVAYNQHEPTYKHYGRNIELLIGKALEVKDEAERMESISKVGKLMKEFYAAWNKDRVEDEVIIQQLKEIAKKKYGVVLGDISAHQSFDLRRREKNTRPANMQQGSNHDKENHGNRHQPTENRPYNPDANLGGEGNGNRMGNAGQNNSGNAGGFPAKKKFFPKKR